MRVKSTSTRPASTLCSAAIVAVGLTAAACERIDQPVTPSVGVSAVTSAEATTATIPAGAAPDISGAWDYAEQTRLVFPGEVAPAFGLATSTAGRTPGSRQAATHDPDAATGEVLTPRGRRGASPPASRAGRRWPVVFAHGP